MLILVVVLLGLMYAQGLLRSMRTPQVGPGAAQPPGAALITVIIPARDEAATDIFTQMARSLRDAGASITATDEAGFCPIVRAIKEDRLKMAGVLINTFSESPLQREKARPLAGCHPPQLARLPA